MSGKSVQYIKWSLPFALLLGLFWYKRRRVDREDPGGLKSIESSKSCEQKNVAKQNTSLCDSGVYIDESFSSNSSPKQIASEEIVCSPRRVSESLDIPGRKSSMMKVQSSPDDAWYKEVDGLSLDNSVQLSSNPKANGLEHVSKSKSNTSALEAIADVGEKAIKDEAKQVEQQEAKTTDKQVCGEKDASAACSESAKTAVESPTNKAKINESTTISERDSANQSPVSGVLEGSVIDEARSEGSTDSGKGKNVFQLFFGVVYSIHFIL